MTSIWAKWLCFWIATMVIQRACCAEDYWDSDEEDYDDSTTHPDECPPQIFTVYTTKKGAYVGRHHYASSFKELVNITTKYSVDSLAFDHVRKEIYFTSKQQPHQIRAVSPITEDHVVISDENRTFDELSVDPLTDNIYYTSGDQEIGVCSSVRAANRKCFTLVRAVSKPNSTRRYHNLILHPKRGAMFWISEDQKANKTRIMLSNMDGTNVRFLKDFGTIFGLALDAHNEILYISDAQKIVRLHLRKFSEEPLSWQYNKIAYFNCKLFFVGRHTRTLEMESAVGPRMHRDSKFIDKSFKSDYSFIVVPDEEQNSTLANPCKNANCSGICVLAEVDRHSHKSQCITRDNPQQELQDPDQLTIQDVEQVLQFVSNAGGKVENAKVGSSQSTGHFWVIALFLALLFVVQSLVLAIVCIRFWPSIRSWFRKMLPIKRGTGTCSTSAMSFSGLKSDDEQ